MKAFHLPNCPSHTVSIVLCTTAYHWADMSIYLPLAAALPTLAFKFKVDTFCSFQIPATVGAATAKPKTRASNEIKMKTGSGDPEFAKKYFKYVYDRASVSRSRWLDYFSIFCHLQ